jgi:hypothetical protein
MHLHVCAGVRYYCKTSLFFINKGKKVNAKYYVLKSFLKNNLSRLFPGIEIVMVFNQDSTCSHTAKMTIKNLNKRKVNYITPAEWMPKCSHDIWINVNVGYGNERFIPCLSLKALKLEQSGIHRT